MSQSQQQRLEFKSLEGQLEYVLKNDFELSPRESQAIDHAVKEITVWNIIIPVSI